MNEPQSASNWRWAAIALLLGLFIFSAIRARDDFHWSYWDFGDAQTMLTLAHWDREGWIANYLLFIPQGYAGVTRLFDEPSLRHHAHGICPISSPGVGPRLWYTHYPSGYLIPYAALYATGLSSIWDARMLSILFSCLALYLMYLSFSRIASPMAGFVAVAFYGLSSAFLQYNDSLANQPLDDLLRFALIYAVVRSTSEDTERGRRNWFMLVWALGFTLSLCSLDSVFFAFIWLIGWDLASGSGFRVKRYFIYGLAPTLAHGLQFMQNAWYLGLDMAIKDIKVTFLTINKTAVGYEYLGNVAGGVPAAFLANVAQSLHLSVPAALMMVALYVFYAVWVSEDRTKWSRLLWVLGAFLLGGVAYAGVFKNGAMMSYQGRQLGPFFGLLAGLVTCSLVDSARLILRDRKRTSMKSWAYAALCAMALGMFWYSYANAPREGYDISPDIKDELVLAGTLKNIETTNEPVILNIFGFNYYYNANYVPGYPQIHPQIEYYAGSVPVLSFMRPESLVDDLLYMIKESQHRFSPLLFAGNAQSAKEVLDLLKDAGALRENSGSLSVTPQMGRYVIDLTNYLKWER